MNINLVLKNKYHIGLYLIFIIALLINITFANITSFIDYDDDNIDDNIEDVFEEIDNESNNLIINKLLDNLPKIETYNYVNLTILNKITSIANVVKFKIGETKSFGKLLVTVEKCIIKKDYYKDSNFTLIKLSDANILQNNKEIFHGWIISSSPSISTIEHPVYEILSNECK